MILQTQRICSKDNVLYTKDMKTLVCTVGSITQVFIPDTVTKIGETAFSGCTGLTEVYLPASLTKIGANAFSKCRNLHTLIVDPANKTYCSKDNVLYTKDMKTLVCAAGAITHISIPDTVIEIGKYVFEDISPDARFTVATEAVKQLLKDSESGIKDEQITVKDVN